jgi:cyclohexanone monooxygenase
MHDRDTAAAVRKGNILSDCGSEEPTGLGQEPEQVDALVVGAGWSGMYMLHRLRSAGYKVVCYEAGDGVGGTWYWNRYPGARCDVSSASYSYSFSEELEQEWTWSEEYATQPEIEAYANHVADRFNLRPYIRFNTRISSAYYRPGNANWDVATDDGRVVRTQFLLLATGGYAVPVKPDIPGLDSFAGETYFTASWPKHRVSFARKRIGVIGTGSSGAQTISAIGNTPFGHLYVFQRTANFVLRSLVRPADPEYTAEFKKQYRLYREEVRQSANGVVYPDPLGYRPVSKAVAELPEHEFEAHMWELWRCGGAGYILTCITDLLSSEKANERVADFLRARIRESVHDPDRAETLCPRDQYVGERRMILDGFYLETYNKPNVSLVDIRPDPLKEITSTGVRTASTQYELDMLILATGFDSGTGSMLAMDIVGRSGVTLAERWAAGASTYLGLMISDFPNMFVIAQVGSPGIRSQVIASGEQHADWIASLLEEMKRLNANEVETTEEAESRWTEHVAAVAEASLLTRHDTQYWGSNVPGKPRTYLAYLGGSGTYDRILRAVRDHGYEGFLFGSEGVHTGNREWSGPGENRASYLGVI